MAEIFTYDTVTQSCTACKSKDIIIKTSKEGNKPYLVNGGDKSYHRTFGKDGKMHCVHNKPEFEWIKVHENLDGCGSQNVTVKTASYDVPRETYSSNLVDNLGGLPNISIGEMLMRDSLERFTLIAYPIAIKYAKLIVGETRDPKDTRICAMGIMHDYSTIYAAFVANKIKEKKGSQGAVTGSEALETIQNIEEPIHPDDE